MNAILKDMSIQLPGRVQLGMGISAKLGETLAAITDDRVLMIVDPVVVTLGLHQSALSSVEAAGLPYDLFSEIQPEPHLNTMQQVDDLLHTHRYGAVVGLGGGSALDVAKLAAVMAYTGCSAEQLFADPSAITGSLPTVLLPTTSGTGSEVSPYSVMSDGRTKKFIGSPHLYAKVAMVDPMLTVSMPPRVTAATGLDALTHGVEGMIGKDTPYTRAMALQCVRLVFTYLPRAVADPNDLEARYQMSVASVMGMLAYTQGGGLYAHSMSYVLTTGHGCPHGVGCGMTLPYTLQFNRDCIAGQLEDISRVLSPADHRLTVDEVIWQFAELVRAVGMPTGLKDVGVVETELDAMASDLVERYYRVLNPVALTVGEARQFVQAMYDECLNFNFK